MYATTYRISTAGVGCNLVAQFLYVDRLIRLLITDRKRIELLLIAPQEQTKSSWTIRDVNH